MIKNILRVISGCLFFGISGCSNDDIGNGGMETEGDIPVTFNIGTPASDEVEYTRAAETASEKQINTLRVYDFRVTGVGSEKKALISAVHHLRKVEGAPEVGEFSTDYDSSGGAMTATLRLSLRGTGNTAIDPPHIFAFVANEEPIHFDSIIRPGVTPIDSLLYCFSTRKLENGDNCDKLAGSRGFVMTALTGEMQITKDMGATTLPQLRRIAARIDVAHSVAADRNLKIVSVSAGNCVSRGYLFGTNYAGSATSGKNDYAHVISVKQNTNVQSALENLGQGTCENVLYLYEQPDAQGEKSTSPVLLLTYTLNGSMNMMEVPSAKDTKLNLQRNTKYTLVVGTDDTTSTRVTCNIRAEE